MTSPDLAAPGLAVDFLSCGASSPAGVNTVTARVDGLKVGQVRYQICDTCEVGRITGIEVVHLFRHRGIGLQMLSAIIQVHERDNWYTSLQLDSSRSFWDEAAARLKATFTEKAACEHMAAARALGG